MKPVLVHRYSWRVSEAIEALLGDAIGDAEGWRLRVDGDEVVVDIIVPSAPAGRAVVAEAPPIAADPEPIEEKPEEAKPAKRKGGALAQRAGIICAEGGFWTFVAKRYGEDIGSADAAAAWLRARCGIESRADLDHDDEPARKFRDISKAYALWLEGWD